MTKKTVLIVEDDELLARMYELKLESAGYRVLSAHTAAHARDHARVQNIDLVLLDILLPKVNGLTVLKELRRNHKTMHCPVIVLSNLAHTEVEMHQEVADALGVVAYLVKSRVTPSMVLDAVHNALKGRT
jgi:DNA-binding response OmpR family regulator